MTPFILSRIGEQTQRRSLTSNIALVCLMFILLLALTTSIYSFDLWVKSLIFPLQVRNNAAVAARIANMAAQRYSPARRASTTASTSTPSPPRRRSLIVAGGATRDITMALSTPPVTGSTTYGEVTETQGGVGRNVLEAAAALGTSTTFISAVGEDAAGTAILNRLKTLNVVRQA